MPRRWKIKLGILLGLFALLLGGLIVFNLLDQSSPRVLPKPPVARLEIGPARVQPKIVSSGLHLVVLADDGSLWGVGYDDWGQAGGTRQRPNAWTSQFQRLPGGANWRDVAALNQVTFALREDGTLWQWGIMLGDALIPAGKGPVQVGTATNWTDISGADAAMFGLRSDGTLWTWGHNVNGYLGLGTTRHQTNPIPLNAETDWADVAAGGSMTVGLKTNGTVWAWGRMFSGDYFDGTIRDLGARTPFQLGTNGGFVRVQCLLNSAVAEDRQGLLWSCHWSDGTNHVWRALEEVPNGLASWSAFGYVVLSLDRKGQAWVMGRNRFGVLARRFTHSSDRWLAVAGRADSAIGMSHVDCAVLSRKNELWLWGIRHDDSEGATVIALDRFRKWLGWIWPGAIPQTPLQTRVYEITPWKAAEFVRTNGIAVGAAP